MKRFKSKKIKNKRKLIRYIFIFFFIFSYVFAFKYTESKRLKDSIINEDINYIKFDIADYAYKKVSRMINNPSVLLNFKHNKISEEKKEEKTIKTISNPTENSNTEVIKEPLVYIYNTHQTEEYNDYNVCDAANLLTSKLNNVGISSIYEEQSVKVFLETNNLKYYKSYAASRTYMNEAYNNNPSLKYFFDIHRDSVSKEKSTISVGNKNYAKVLLIVGLDNPGNQKNLNNANKLNSIINSKVSGISRGVITKGGKGVNGIYNQDFSENVFLIEIGGKDNTKEEIENTINIISESIIEYIRGVI